MKVLRSSPVAGAGLDSNRGDVLTAHVYEIVSGHKIFLLHRQDLTCGTTQRQIAMAAPHD